MSNCKTMAEVWRKLYPDQTLRSPDHHLARRRKIYGDLDVSHQDPALPSMNKVVSTAVSKHSCFRTQKFAAFSNQNILISKRISKVCFLIYFSFLLMPPERAFNYLKISNPLCEKIQDSLFPSVCFISYIAHVNYRTYLYLYCFIIFLFPLH